MHKNENWKVIKSIKQHAKKGKMSMFRNANVFFSAQLHNESYSCNNKNDSVQMAISLIYILTSQQAENGGKEHSQLQCHWIHAAITTEIWIDLRIVNKSTTRKRKRERVSKKPNEKKENNQTKPSRTIESWCFTCSTRSMMLTHWRHTIINRIDEVIGIHFQFIRSIVRCLHIIIDEIVCELDFIFSVFLPLSLSLRLFLDQLHCCRHNYIYIPHAWCVALHVAFHWIFKYCTYPTKWIAYFPHHLWMVYA